MPIGSSFSCRPRRRLIHHIGALLVTLGLVATACTQDGERVDISSTLDQPTIGFIFVGARDDLGYNEVAWSGSEALARTFPNATVLRTENVPEDDTAVAAMDDLIEQGARIVFATSFGHYDAAVEVARSHPDVVVVHQGATPPTPGLPNFGTYFGTHSDVMYASGVAAGATTQTGELGMVVAFPIPATHNNLNAFLLGARTQRPDAELLTVFTGSWCDTDAQDAALGALLARDVDVVGMHQDCTRNLLEQLEAAGVAAVGYHSDGSEVAPTQWLTGAVWDWAPVYRDIVSQVIAGTFADSPYSAGFRGGLDDATNPLVLAEPGPRLDAAGRAAVDAAVDAVARGEIAVFEGPLVDTGGVERVPAGQRMSQDDIDLMDWMVDGVVDVSADVDLP